MNLIRLFAALFLFCLLVGCAHTPSEFQYSDDASGDTVDAMTGDLITITLPAGNDPACFWKLVHPVDPHVLLTMDIKQGKAKRSGSSVTEPVVQYQYRVIGPGSSGISLEYRGYSKVTGELELRRFNLLVMSTGKPFEFTDIFEDGPPPDTMTDSKGNVLKKPEDLPGKPR